MPSCSHLGYTHTTQSQDLQLILENVLKRKLHKFGNHSVCSPMLKKIFCAEFAPPCFPDDKTEIILRTVCKSECENVREECPALYREHFGEYSYCEQMGTAKSNLKGFCQLTKWPTAVRWPSRPNATSKLKCYSCYLETNNEVCQPSQCELLIFAEPDLVKSKYMSWRDLI